MLPVNAPTSLREKKKKKKIIEELLVLRYSSRHKLNSCCPGLFQVTQKSGAHVRISSDGGESERQNVCFQLYGSKEQVLLARCVLQNLAIDCEPVVEVLEVPQAAFGRIIGNCRVDSFSSLVQNEGKSSLFVCLRPWRRGIKTDNQNHGGQSFLFQRQDTKPRCKGDCDNQRDQGGGETGQSK